MDGKLSQGPKYGYGSGVAAGLSRGPNRKKLLNAAAWSDTWPAPGAVVDLDFTNDRSYIKGVGQSSSLANMTFTGSAGVTYFDKDGFLKTVYTDPPQDYQQTGSVIGSINRFTNSQDFTAATWSRTSLTAAFDPNVLAPDGVSQATRITEASGVITEAVILGGGSSYAPGGNNTISVYAKEAPNSAKRYIYIGIKITFANTRWGWVIFDLATQEYTIRGEGVQTAVLGANITPLENGWYRISAIVNSPLASYFGAIGITDSFAAPNSYNLGGYTGDGSSGMYIWGAQSELTVGRTSLPRFDWSIIDQTPAPNRVRFSEDFLNGAWGKFSVGVSATTDTNPFGVPSSWRITPTGAASQFPLINQNIVFEGQHTISIYAKANGYDKLAISIQSFNVTTFNLTTGATIAGSGVATPVGNGWYRCSWSVNVNATLNLEIGVARQADGQWAGWTPNGVDGVLVWAAQIESGSLANQYVVTGAAPITSLPAAAVEKSNGLLVEHTRVNRVLWCRDPAKSFGTNFIYSSANPIYWVASGGVIDANTGPELIINGDFLTGSNNWILATGTSVANGVATVGNGGTSALRQQNVLQVGKDYLVSITFVGSSGGTDSKLHNSGFLPEVLFSNPPISSAAGTYSMVVRSRSVDFNLSNFSGSLQVDNISAKEITPNYTTGPGNGNAVTLRAVSANATFSHHMTTLGSLSGNKTFSVWLKRKTGSGNVDISVTSSSWVTQPVTNEWARYSVTQGGNAVSPGIRISDANDEIEVWGPQLTPGAISADYQPTSSTAITGWSKLNVNLSRSVVGIDGISNTATAITAAANDAVLFHPSFLTSATRTSSIFLRRLSGEGDVFITVDGESWSKVTLTNQWVRFISTSTTVNTCIGVKLSTAGDSVAMDYAQVEDNIYIGTPIFTTGAAVVTAGDQVTLSGPLFRSLFNQASGALYWAGRHWFNNTSNKVCYIGDGTYYRLMGIAMAASNVNAFGYTVDGFIYPGGDTPYAVYPSMPQGSYRKAVGSYTPTRVSYSMNGRNTVFGHKISYTPFTQWFLSVGSDDAGASSPKYVDRVILWDKAIPDAGLQDIST